MHARHYEITRRQDFRGAVNGARKVINLRLEPRQCTALVLVERTNLGHKIRKPVSTGFPRVFRKKYAIKAGKDCASMHLRNAPGPISPGRVQVEIISRDALSTNFLNWFQIIGHNS